MKIFIKLLLLTLFDFIAIYLWVKQIDPSPSVAIGIIIVIPTVIIINFAIALILYFTKKEHAKLFVLNAFISAILMNYLFVKGIDRNLNRSLEMWEFKIKDTTFTIIHWKLNNTFDISESTNSGSSTSLLEGKTIKENKILYLTTDSTKYKIKNEYLYGFRMNSDSIELKKIER
jgi:membrane protein YdbS with pleckstrin-like domain